MMIDGAMGNGGNCRGSDGDGRLSEEILPARLQQEALGDFEREQLL